MPRILVTNDDGGRSDGIHALAEAVRRLGDVTVVAPNVEASAIGHALTLRRPLRMEQIGEGIYEVDGTPTDCVNIALTQLFDGRIDLIISGINKGYNIGDDITYSGTVAGRDGGGAARDSRHRGVAGADAAARTISPRRRPRRRPSPRRCCAADCRRARS